MSPFHGGGKESERPDSSVVATPRGQRPRTIPVGTFAVVDLPKIPKAQPRPNGATEGLGAGEPIPSHY